MAISKSTEPDENSMILRFQTATAFLLLAALSQSATAASDFSSPQEPQSEQARLQISSERAFDSLGRAQIEFTVSSGPSLSQAWLLSVDVPSELVAVRARLEGRRAATPPTGDFDLRPIRLDEEGRWSQRTLEDGLRTWYQAFVVLADGGFEFSDLTRGTRSTLVSSFSGATAVQNGFVVMTEFMKDPSQVSDTQGEWVEVYNAGHHRANLEGSVFSDDGSNAHLIYIDGSGLLFLPGKRLVFGRNADSALNGGVVLDYEYSGFTLGNGADQIILTGRNGVLLDRVEYDDGVLWPDSSGMSISLAPGAEHAILNDDGANWCHSTSPVALGSSDTGTPGSQNDVCP